MRTHKSSKSVSPSLSTLHSLDAVDPFARSRTFHENAVGDDGHTTYAVTADGRNYSPCIAYITSRGGPAHPTSVLTQMSPLRATERSMREGIDGTTDSRRWSITMFSHSDWLAGSPLTPRKTDTYEDWMVQQAAMCTPVSAAHQIDVESGCNTPSPYSEAHITQAGHSIQRTITSDRALKRAEDLQSIEQHLHSFESFLRRFKRPRHSRVPTFSTTTTTTAYAGLRDGKSSSPNVSSVSWDRKVAEARPRAAGRGCTNSLLHIALSTDAPFPRETTSTRYFDSRGSPDQRPGASPEKEGVVVDRRDGKRRLKRTLWSLIVTVLVLASVAMIVMGAKTFKS